MIAKKLPRLVMLAVLILLLISGCGHTDTATEAAGEDLALLAGKSILFTGDSLTNGHGLDDFYKSWCGMLETTYGMQVTTQSISGSTVSDAPQGMAPMCTRPLPEGPFDIVFLEGTGNDWHLGIPIGNDYESRDTQKEIGAVNVLIDRVQEAYPDALVVFMAPWNSTGEVNSLGLTSDAYTEMLYEICRLRNIPCFPSNDPEISGVDATTETGREKSFLSKRDRWHLNEKAHQRILPIIAHWLAGEYAGFMGAED